MKRRPIQMTCALAFALALGACGMRLPFVSSTAGAKTSYFATKVCGVYVDGKSSEARLRIELTVTRSLPRNAFIEVEFENPADRKVPLLASRSVTGSERTLQMLSPPLTTVRARAYETVTRVYASPDKKQVLGIHTQMCESLIDQHRLGL
jgi:hypothetical protein